MRNQLDKKTRKHSLCEKIPYIAVILSMIIPMLIVGIGGSLGEKVSSDAGNIGICIFAVIAMFAFGFWFSPEFKGFVKPGCSAKDICVVLILLGLLFTALYLGTGSAVFPVFAHGLHDFISFTTDQSLSADGIITQQYGTGQLLYELVLVVIIGIASLSLLNRNKLAQANELWNEKWSNICVGECE